MVIDGICQKFQMIFSNMMNELYEETTNQSSEEEPKQTTNSRWNEGGSYNSKPLNKKYFKNHNQQKVAIKIECLDCGRKTSKTNLSKHRQTAICKNIKQ